MHNANYKPKGPCGRRIMCNTRGEANQGAKRAGGGREPLHDPGGEHGPHYHPDVPQPDYPWDPSIPVPRTPSPHDHWY